MYGNDDSSWNKFMFTFPSKGNDDTAPVVYVTTQERYPVMVNVTVPGIGFNHSTEVTHNQSATIDVPPEVVITSAGIKESNKAVIVVASDTVSVYGSQHAGTLTATFFVLPTKVLGNDYVAVGYYGSNIVILATEDDTTVSIPGRLLLTLKKNECYQDFPGDITGISIKTSKPVSVMSGHVCATVTTGTCNYIMQNLPPVNHFGQQYILSPFLGRTSGFVYRVVSVSPGITNVAIEPGEIFSLSPGEFYEGNTATTEELLTITSDNPVLISQYTKSQATNDFGDPFMVVIPSTQHFSHNATFPTIALKQSNPNYHVSITSRCDTIDLFSLDDMLLSTQNMLQTSDGEFCVLRTSVNPGFHSVTHPSASFFVLVYGFAYADAYGYKAGYQVRSEDNSSEVGK